MAPFTRHIREVIIFCDYIYIYTPLFLFFVVGLPALLNVLPLVAAEICWVCAWSRRWWALKFFVYSWSLPVTAPAAGANGTLMDQKRLRVAACALMHLLHRDDLYALHGYLHDKAKHEKRLFSSFQSFFKPHTKTPKIHKNCVSGVC